MAHSFFFFRKAPKLGSEGIIQAIEKYWPELQRILPFNIKEAAIIDKDGPLAGGPAGPFILQFFSTADIPANFREVIENTIGWAPKRSTVEYVDAYYSKFTDPTQAYLEDMVVHELGHLYFGAGITISPSTKQDEWFQWGIGLLYDRLVWSRFNSQSSPLFDGTDRKLQEFKILPVDQRLIDPDTSRDAEFKLSRKQVYGHAKSYAFLKAVRIRFGEEKFDHYIKVFLFRNVGRECRYDNFLNVLSTKDRETVFQVEREFNIR